MKRSTPYAASACAALVLLLAVAGCDRKPRLVPEGADSTTTMTADSMAVYVQMAQQRWDSPDQIEEAAGLIARVLFDDLRAHPDASVIGRARDFLDSLRTGAELFGTDDLAVVNLFARSNPTAGSWPWIAWRDAEGSLRSQALDAIGMHLDGVSVDADEGENVRVAALFTRTTGQGQSPYVFVWQKPPTGSMFRLAQSLGSDSLGTTGTARLMDPGPSGVVLMSRTYQIMRGFSECPSCPHIYRTRSFRWGATGLVSAADEVENTPYSSFVQFILALSAGDRELAAYHVADPMVVETAIGYQFGQSRGLWRLSPGSTANARELILLRGSSEAYKVQFTRRGEEWLITSLEPSNRNIE